MFIALCLARNSPFKTTQATTGSRFAVSMADVFPHGCHLVPDSISEAIDYDKETKRRSPALDKLTGKPVFQVRVIDLDPELSG